VTARASYVNTLTAISLRSKDDYDKLEGANGTYRSRRIAQRRARTPSSRSRSCRRSRQRLPATSKLDMEIGMGRNTPSPLV
jgi:hypothetical protein